MRFCFVGRKILCTGILNNVRPSFADGQLFVELALIFMNNEIVLLELHPRIYNHTIVCMRVIGTHVCVRFQVLQYLIGIKFYFRKRVDIGKSSVNVYSSVLKEWSSYA